MKEIKKNRLFVDYLVKPVMLGLFVAAVLIVLVPDFRPTTNSPSDDLMTLEQANISSDWAGQVSYAVAVSRAAPSVVNVYTLKGTNNGSPRTSLGSGVIMQSSGVILTNHHVIDGAMKIIVLLYDGREAAASIVGSDPEIDLAVLKINIEGLTPIALGDPDQARIGDVVLAIGNPSGIGQSVTQGIISAKGRTTQQENIFENFIQTDAAINAGSSGGALVDAYGNLLGINTAKLGASGISFAIPVDEAQTVLEDILQHGRVVRGWLGMSANPGFLAESIAKELGVSQTFGISGITNGGPADNSGIRVGDLIVKIDAVPVTDPTASVMQITNVSPGQPVKISVLREDKLLEFTVIAGDRGEALARGLL